MSTCFLKSQKRINLVTECITKQIYVLTWSSFKKMKVISKINQILFRKKSTMNYHVEIQCFQVFYVADPLAFFFLSLWWQPNFCIFRLNHPTVFLMRVFQMEDIAFPKINRTLYILITEENQCKCLANLSNLVGFRSPTKSSKFHVALNEIPCLLLCIFDFCSPVLILKFPLSIWK